MKSVKVQGTDRTKEADFNSIQKALSKNVNYP